MTQPEAQFGLDLEWRVRIKCKRATRLQYGAGGERRRHRRSVDDCELPSADGLGKTRDDDGLDLIGLIDRQGGERSLGALTLATRHQDIGGKRSVDAHLLILDAQQHGALFDGTRYFSTSWLV